MTLRGMLAAGVLLVAAMAGCRRHDPRSARVETVTDLGAGRYWAAGTEGLAVYHDGAPSPRPYEPADGAFDGAYGANAGVPVARVVRVAGEPLLFLRHAEVRAWRGERWASLPVKFPGEAGRERGQIDHVLEGPAGEIVVHLHDRTLLWTTPGGLLRSEFTPERAPTYFTWLGYVRGELAGLGWDDSGNVRALWLRGTAGGWRLVCRLAAPRDGGSPLAVIAVPGRGLGVAYATGLYEPAEAGRADAFRPLVHLAAGPADREGAWKGVSLVGTSTPAGRGPLLLFAGARSGALELGAGEHTLWAADTSAATPIGVVTDAGGGLSAITAEGARLSLTRAGTFAERPAAEIAAP